MNNMYDGHKVPSANVTLQDPDAQEVSLNALQKEMSEVELDFLRSCLVIDGTARPTVEELMAHAYFDPEFLSKFDSTLAEMESLDEENKTLMKSQILRTKSDRLEVPHNEIFTESDNENSSSGDEAGDSSSDV
jgi:serine/threonine protein kinase